MKILFLSTWFPYPLDNGSRIRVHALLQGLSQAHSVHLLSFLPPSLSQEVISQVNCERVAVVRRDPFWRHPLKHKFAYFSWKPRAVVAGYSREMAQAAQEMDRQEHYDLVIASVTEVAAYALLLQGKPLLLEEHNFMTAWMKEQAQNQVTLRGKLARALTFQKSLLYERWLYPHFQGVSMVSQVDCQAVRRLLPGYSGQLSVIPNGVDLESRPFNRYPAVPDTIVFNGALTYSANAGAMRFFILDVLPLIWQQRPQVRLAITGRHAGVDLSWMPVDERIQFTGYLEDVCPAVGQSWLAVAPLREGGGTRLKILEAMALGTPVVATHKGAEGLEISPGVDIQLADRPEAFADSCLEVLKSPSTRRQQARLARRLVEEKYDWKMIAIQFRQLVEMVAAGYNR